jgi:hypothetical protein
VTTTRDLISELKIINNSTKKTPSDWTSPSLCCNKVSVPDGRCQRRPPCNEEVELISLHQEFRHGRF